MSRDLHYKGHMHMREHAHHFPETHTYQSVDHLFHSKVFGFLVGLIAVVLLIIRTTYYYQERTEELYGTIVRNSGLGL